jgi:hypothetical protein
VHCFLCEVGFQTRCHLAYPFTWKKKLGVAAHFREKICKKQMRQNLGKEKQKSTCFGIFFTKSAYFQVINFIPVEVSTLCIHSYLPCKSTNPDLESWVGTTRGMQNEENARRLYCWGDYVIRSNAAALERALTPIWLMPITYRSAEAPTKINLKQYWPISFRISMRPPPYNEVILHDWLFPGDFSML